VHAVKIVRIHALPREGFSSRPRAGRFFPASEPVTMEVVDQEEDPTIDVEKTDSAGKRYLQKVPDPKRMSKKVFESMILPDPVLRVLADGETVSVLSQAALDAARRQASELAGKLTDAEVAKVALGEKLAASQAEGAALKARVAELEAAVAKASGEGPPAPPAAPEAPPAPGGKGGKAK
jgi:hypothetical protein